jgi:ribose 5-phosphate isomerase B
MGAWVIGRATAEEVVEAFLNARFDNDEDTVRRVGKLRELERSSARELSKEMTQ